jgi:predicted dehydrogenase
LADDRKLKTGLIGAGSFATHHAGKLASLDRSAFQGVFDPDLERAEAMARHFGCRAFSTAEACIAACDSVIVASPAHTHFAYGHAALSTGRHVYIEKPLAERGDDADALVAEANKNRLVLQVGHQERFVADAIGLFDVTVRPSRIESVREGPGTGRGEDVSVTLDLMIHDLDLALELIGAPPLAVTAQGEGDPLNVVKAEVRFQTGATASFQSSRRAAERRRTTRLVYPKGALEIDFVARTMKDETGLDFDPDFAAKAGDPLGAGVVAFLDACLGLGSVPAPGAAAAKAVHLANMIDVAALT